MIIKSKTGEEQVKRIEDTIIQAVFRREGITAKELRHHLSGFRSSEDSGHKVKRQEIDSILNRMVDERLLKWHVGCLFIPMNPYSLMRLAQIGLVQADQTNVIGMMS
jgi:hypothetical protein